MAAALRLLDRFDEALACLAEADAVTAADDHATRAPLEHLRGNLLFTIGDLPGCRSAHERALAHARAGRVGRRRGRGPERPGRRLLPGRAALTSAGRAFEDCRALARTHGILRMEAASGLMLGLTDALRQRARRGASPRPSAALELADRIDDLRLQCLAAAVATALYRERGDCAAVRRLRPSARRPAARRLGSERLEAMGVEALSPRRCCSEGRRREALSLARQALALCRAQRRPAGERALHPGRRWPLAEDRPRGGAGGAGPGRGAAGRRLPLPQPLRAARGRASTLALQRRRLGRGPAPRRRPGAAPGRRAAPPARRWSSRARACWPRLGAAPGRQARPASAWPSCARRPRRRGLLRLARWLGGPDPHFHARFDGWAIAGFDGRPASSLACPRTKENRP